MKKQPKFEEFRKYIDNFDFFYEPLHFAPIFF